MDSVYRQGYNAFSAGKSFEDNPYEKGTVDYDAWSFGWDDAQVESLRKDK